MSDDFDIVLALARMATIQAGKDQANGDRVVHQVRRLEGHCRQNGRHDDAAKLAHILTWYDAGCPPSAEVIMLSEHTNNH